MAGIPWALHKLLKAETLLHPIYTYFQATMIASGQWLMTVVTLAVLHLLIPAPTAESPLVEFRVVLLYNFAFSLVLSAPITLALTRHINDDIYSSNMHNICGLLLGSIAINYLITLPIGFAFYFFYVVFPLEVRLMAFLNLGLVSSLWIFTPYLTAIKHYRLSSITFFIGMVAATLLCFFFASYSITGMLAGFNVGLLLILATFIAGIFNTYPRMTSHVFSIFESLKRYRSFALAILMYNIAIWSDKWIMWFSPDRTLWASGLISFPPYDSVVFFAYLTTIPALSAFVFFEDTYFLEKYAKLTKGIHSHNGLKKINEDYDDVFQSGVEILKDTALVQGVVALIAIALAPLILDWLGINIVMTSMFRYTILAASLQLFILIITILLSYFNLSKGILIIQSVFLITNIVLPWITMEMGIAYYGLGYFLSTLITLAICLIVTERYTREPIFRLFVEENPATTQTMEK